MKIKITQYKGFNIEHKSLFYVINLEDGPRTFRKMKEAKDWIDEQEKSDNTSN